MTATANAGSPPPSTRPRREFFAREGNSLRRRLLLFLLVPVSATVVLVSILVYVIASTYSDRVHDDGLLEDVNGMAKVLRASRSDGQFSPQASFLLEYSSRGHNHYSVRSLKRGLLSGSREPMPVGPVPHDGAAEFYDTRIGGVNSRAVSIAIRAPTDASDTLVVTLAEAVFDRQLRARQILLMSILLQLVLTAVLLALMWRGVSRGLRALDPLIQHLAEHGQELVPIGDLDVPSEIRPLSWTIDALLERIRRLFVIQEHFIADAAHQMRTPLAGLSLHADRARTSANEKDRSAALAQVQVLTMRLARTASQLLALTRAQAPLEPAARMAPVRLDQLLPEILAEHVARALSDGVDLGYEAPEAAVTILADAYALHDAIDNLIDNALNYVPRGGTVSVGLRIEDGSAIIAIDDDGPGVPDAALPRLGDRFFRAPEAIDGGTGLGLAIVRRIAERHGARVRYLRSRLGGLCVEIDFPLFADLS
ncbi:sensor histidine kinase [Lysobacter capsici]|uniref:sensor histidine kinase n=1 Tax=Lysobacter capsici TaxID=435897 RepID=UPI001C001F0F|nr:sensor histidine kinase [Lysobacter capsici]QWF17543.1 sensor histidine kinase [Lysobacter capsici]